MRLTGSTSDKYSDNGLILFDNSFTSLSIKALMGDFGLLLIPLIIYSKSYFKIPHCLIANLSIIQFYVRVSFRNAKLLDSSYFIFISRSHIDSLVISISKYLLI